MALALLADQDMSTLCEGMLCAVLLFVPVAGWSQQHGDALESNTVSWVGPESNTVPRVGAESNVLFRSGTEKLKYLEQKARDHDLLVIKIKQLESELSKKRTQPVQTNAPMGRHRLETLEWKAQRYSALLVDVEQKDKKIAELKQCLDQLEQEFLSLQDESAFFNNRMAAMSNTVQQVQEHEKKLRATVDQLVLGNFEYYEIKSGDTIESIAKNPLIYDDASKASWLRQANWDRVKDIDHLREGEMLIIPRFFSSDLFTF